MGILEPNTLWLAPSEPGTHTGGSGTFSDPVRITSAEDFDAAITRTEFKHLRLHAGVYLTRCNWAWPRQCILPNGGSLIGAGVGRTIIRLAESAAFTGTSGTHLYVNVLWLGVPDANNGGWTFSDLTIESCHIRASLDATVARFLLASMNSPRATRLRVSGCTYPAFAETRQAVALMNHAASNPLVLTNNTTIA